MTAFKTKIGIFRVFMLTGGALHFMPSKERGELPDSLFFIQNHAVPAAYRLFPALCHHLSYPIRSVDGFKKTIVFGQRILSNLPENKEIFSFRP
jgi:hypothetical protein